MMRPLPHTPRAGGWGWKRATSTDDVMGFLNGEAPYPRPVSDCRIAATARDGGVDFSIFYRRSEPASWGWKLATDPDDAQSFLNGQGGYGPPVRDAQIAVVAVAGSPRFFIVYRRGGDDTGSSWGWKRSTDATDVVRFLNGEAPYHHPTSTARIAELSTGTHDEFFVFYKREVEGGPIANWGWKRSTDPEDALDFVNGTDPYSDPLPGYEVTAVQRQGWRDFHVFSNRGTAIWLQSPLEGERFVRGEPISLDALVTSELPVDNGDVEWSSSLDGLLGSGSHLAVTNLSTGTHQIGAAAAGMTATTSVRVFSDLWELYRAAPAPAEIERIANDFTLAGIDGTGIDEAWAPYGDLTFDQTSTDPNMLVAIAKLDVLRHQRFAEPLPFTNGATVYEHLAAHVRTLNLHLECRLNSAGGDTISLSRNFSVWDPRLGMSSPEPDACKEPFGAFELELYGGSLKLLVHEGRHCEPDDPGHDFCDGRPKDTTLEGGSGYAQGALYDMWVSKYSLYDPPEIRERAKWAATGALQSVFCSTPTHSDPRVQAIIDELLGS